tara:strand:- start:1458 stop:1946 length:489 start_codon:yes stop_codon:yes gene_type:complete
MNKIQTKKYELFQSFPMTWETVLSGASEDEIFKTVHHEIAEMELERRSRDTLKERFAKIDETNEYRLCDLIHSGDKILIKTTPNVISSSIVLEYTNTKYDVESEILSIRNCDGAWRILANMNNSHNVEVLVQVWDKDGETYEEVPLQNSRPYEYRLEKGVFN